jgi:hypothetical protein
VPIFWAYLTRFDLINCPSPKAEDLGFLAVVRKEDSFWMICFSAGVKSLTVSRFKGSCLASTGSIAFRGVAALLINRGSLIGSLGSEAVTFASAPAILTVGSLRLESRATGSAVQ